MKNFFYFLIGMSVIGYSVYVVIKVLSVIFGASGGTLFDISGHLIFIGVLLIIIISVYFWDLREKKNNITKQLDSQTESGVEGQFKATYNPYEDKLHFDVYQQHFKTWWFDSDSDKHERGNIYANLRFYEDGTVIGIRSSTIPKLNVPDSYTMKGTWTIDKNKICISLKKISEIEDTVKINISDSEEKDMKYYGEIADDDSLIKAGDWTGIIRGNSIIIDDHSFLKLANETLIVTAGEDFCDRLESKVIDHPFIISSYQDTGNWYSNGETGPEWFTLHIISVNNRKKEIEEFVNKQLREMDTHAGLFWS